MKYFWKLNDGWYYRTADEDLVGPFPTEKLARQKFLVYIKCLNGEKDGGEHAKAAPDIDRRKK